MRFSKTFRFLYSALISYGLPVGGSLGHPGADVGGGGGQPGPKYYKQYDSLLITSQYTQSKYLSQKHNIEFDFDVRGKIRFPNMKRDFYVILTNPKNKD